ncbi:hypothetical protein P43SY_011172 [Pythium insidiosum]|uniref:Uncharacterized protein n=1 Tax=Pythium insidiosum TaxID=114742 RepID=A0AAD5Q599_PYTIN|nr:hypothetical protein P43SY_011172 [Pythium insidiosum]
MRVPLQLNTTHNFFICYQLAWLTVAPGQRLLGSEAFIQELVINETTSAREERIQIVRNAPLSANPGRTTVSETIVNEWW